jgi:predicted amidohydrolase
MSTLTITTIQADLRWEDKAANLQRFEEKILGIPEPTEIVVLPEMFSTGFSMKPQALAEKMDGPTIAWMKTIAAEKRVILTGSIIIEEGGHYFNRLIWMLPNGQYGYYDKRHRFAYAGENEQYTAGRKRLIASVKGWKVLLLVCYDLRFPVWSRQGPAVPGAGLAGTQGAAGLPAERGVLPANGPDEEADGALADGAQGKTPEDGPGLEYDLILYVANWPERRSLAWKTLLQARAIENQSFVVGVNRVGMDGNNIYHSGDSMVIDPLGEVLSLISNKETIFTHTLRKERLDEARSRFPFWRDADHFSIEP